MKATDLLKMQHREVEALFASFEQSKKSAERAKIFEDVAARLVAHDAIEREIFYPACERQMGSTELLGEALVEHGLVEFSLYRADQNRGNDDLAHHVMVLKEVVEHHVKEEEKELIPRVSKAFPSEELEELGQAMEARFEQALTEDFRQALVDNLRQVLAGATKTTPKASAKKGAAAQRNVKRTSAKRGTSARKGAPMKSGSATLRASSKNGGAKKTTRKKTGSKSSSSARA